MVSSTTNKKELVDFLWEWAGNKDWSKLLVKKVVSSESSLQLSDREKIFKYFLQDIGLETGLPRLSLTKPNYTPNSKHVELVSLSDVTGVNKLAKEQTINFSSNITVIYGENGTGKSGYGRILKAIGFSYDHNNVIYPNVFGEPEPKTAKIKYKSNGVEDIFDWKGDNRNTDLESISVFNNNCVKISLGGSRQLIVSPIGFHLFTLISSELGELDSLLGQKMREYPIEISWLDSLNDGTPQQQFINSLSKDSSEENLKDLSIFGEEQEKELERIITKQSNLNKALLQNEIAEIKSQIGELKSIIEKIEYSQSKFNKDVWVRLMTINKDISELEKITQIEIGELASIHGIEFYETDEFKSFLSAAESYIKRMNQLEYPNEDDVCVYCRQPLEQNAKELLTNYRRLLNDETEENITKLKIKKRKLVTLVGKIDTSLKLNHAGFGLDGNDKPIQPTEFINYNQELTRLKNLFVEDQLTEESVFDFSYNDVIKLVTDKKDELGNQREDKEELYENIDNKEQELKKSIFILEDQKLLSNKVEDIKKIIANHQTIDILNQHSNSFNTSSISRKTSQAREYFVSHNFREIFLRELKALKKIDLPIEISFETDRGTTKLTHRISNHKLLEILSEGEQKAIALAEFLAELQLETVKAPVIFDDPVNSLDHKIIDAVAKRLINLSGDRQLVIFTHSILLFNSLMYLGKQPTYKPLHKKFYNVRNEYDKTGYITDAEEVINSVKQRIKIINTCMDLSKERPEQEVVNDCYEELRSAIELCVEHEIFKGTVKRYQKNVSLTNFLKIDSVKLGEYQEALNDIFERCCGFIRAHSNPQNECNSPSLEDFTIDFEEFKKIRKDFL